MVVSVSGHVGVFVRPLWTRSYSRSYRAECTGIPEIHTREIRLEPLSAVGFWGRIEITLFDSNVQSAAMGDVQINTAFAGRHGAANLGYFRWAPACKVRPTKLRSK